MSIIVREALSTEDRESVFRLRYEIYVEEMGRKQTYADSAARTVREPFDETAHLFLAEDDGKPVGTIRCNLRKDGPLECEELYGIEQFGPFYPKRVSMTTKLMVKESHRNTMATTLLIVQAYRCLRDNGAKLDFIDTNPHLVRLYQQMGYRIYKENINHPDYGNVIPMVFLLDDVEYMKMIGSPFRRYARGYENTEEAWEFFHKAFRDYAYIRPVFATSPDKVLELFSRDKHRDPTEFLTFMKGFAEEEAATLLGQLDLIPYDEGDYVFQQGDEGNGMFCILEGQVQVIIDTPDGSHVPVAILNEGEIFGEMGFISNARRTASIRVRSKSKILCLSPSEFTKLEKNLPHLTVKLLVNLFSILVERFNDKQRALLDVQGLLDSILKEGQLSSDQDDDQGAELPGQPTATETARPPGATPVDTATTPGAPQMNEQEKGSYTVGDYSDASGEIARLRAQAQGGFALEKSVFERIGLRDADKILDAGCGPGFVAAEVAREFRPRELTGIDLDPSLIEIALRENAYIPGIAIAFSKGSIYDLQLPDSSFDLSYSRFVFQHLDRPLHALEQVVSKVRSGGRVVIEDIDDGMLFLEPQPASYDRVQNNAEKLQSELGGNRRIGRTLHGLMVAAGLEDVAVEVLPVSTTMIGVEAFVHLAYGFKFDHLARTDGAEAGAAARAEFMALASNPRTYGTLNVFFAHGRKP